MSYQKLKPCPNCETDAHLDVFTYDNGWRHVECLKCNYLGPGEGNIRQAIKSYNERIIERHKEYADAIRALAVEV